MFIALEGCDGTGKSTLADAIEAELMERDPEAIVQRLHFSQLKNDPIDEYALQFEGYRPGTNRHIIADRLHWGETIYGPLYRFESALTPEAFRWVEMYLTARGAITVHVTAALETIRERLAVRGEEYLQTHDVEHVWSQFSHVASQSLMSGTAVETDKASPEKLAHFVVNEAAFRDSAAALVFRPEYIGRALPTALLVGDAQGNSDPGVTAAPFMVRGKSCGGYLLGALPERWWHQVGIVNSHETDLLALMSDLYNPQVVALGSNASAVLADLGIDHGVVPHPQKIKRFHHAMQREYGDLIRTVSEHKENKLSWPKS